jgi:hypothetical protein
VVWSLRILGILAAVVVASLIAGRPEAPTVREEQQPLRRLTGERVDFAGDLVRLCPEVVLLGNSILARGVDEDGFSRLSGVRTRIMTHGGAASAMWYLLLKNVIVPSEERPRVVGIVFRDTYLTEPGYRVKGKYRKKLDYYSSGDEPELERLAYHPGRGRIESLFHHRWGLFEKRARFQDLIEGAFKTDLPASLLALEPIEVEAAVEEAFAEEKLETGLLGRAEQRAEVDLSQGDHLDFDARVRRSFLPLIVELAAANDVRLVLIRSKSRRDAEPFPAGYRAPAWAAEGVPRYMAALEAYLDSVGVPLLDFGGDPRIRREHYGNGDHLSESEGKPLFTRLLAEEMAPFLQ